MKHLFITLIFLFNNLILIAQPLCLIKHYSINDGMSQGIVVDILQDKKGFLWFSTWNGLNKFDGYSFKCYKTSQNDSYILKTNRLNKISETSNGDIWCQTYDKRIYLFDSQTEQFIDILGPLEKHMKQNFYTKRTYNLKKGITWIVLENGSAFRVDEQVCKKGKGIALFNTTNQNIKGNQIQSIFEDSEGDEWILTDKGISIIGKKQINTDLEFLFFKEINGIIYLFSQTDKIGVYNMQNQKFKLVDIPYHTASIRDVRMITPDMMALATEKGLILYYPSKNQFELLDIRTPSQPSNDIQAIYQDRKQDLWIFPNSLGVIRYNLSTCEKQHLFTPADKVIKHERKNRNLIFEDLQGTLWVLPSVGNLSYYDRNEKELKPLLTDASDPKSIYSPLVRVYMLDKQGNCWLGSTRGVEKISFFPHTYTLNSIDQGYETRALLCDHEKRLWVASKAQIIRIYASNGQLQGYLTPEGKISKEKKKFTNTYSFLEDHDGNIWMGTKEDGIYLLKRKTKDTYSIHHFNHQSNNPYSLSGNSVYSIFQDSYRRIWVGCYGSGLNLLNHTQDGKTQFIHSGNKLKNLPTDYAQKVRHISEKNGVILVGTTDGLITFSSDFKTPEDIKFYRNCCESGLNTCLSGNDVRYIYTDKQKQTYVVSFAGGVNKIVSEDLLSSNIKFKTYSTSEGLSSDLVLSMQEDKQGNLWILSENTISRFNPINETFENYGLNSLHREFCFSEANTTINSRNQIVVGTDKGFIEFSPQEMKKSAYVPPIVFTGLKIQGEPTIVAIDDLKEVHLTPNQRNITFQFAALDYIDSKEIRYAYRLEGLEDEWNNEDKSRSASYINLSPGKYNFQIKSTNSDGVWTDNIRTISVNVLPTFWETKWAWLLYIILFILFTATIVYVLFYIYRLRHQVDIEQQLSNVKLRFFTDISHELRTPLTLISSPINEVLEDKSLSPTTREHLTLVQKNTDRMLRLMNQILDFRKIQNQKMKMLIERTDLIPLIEKLMESFRLIAEEKKIDYRLISETKPIHAWIDKDKFEKIFFNLISNAFKYTPEGKAINIKITKQSEKITISVIDEGIGIEQDKQNSLFQRFETLVHYNILQPSSGIGLSLVKEMVDMHHGSIEVTSEIGKGSCFTVILPLKREVFEQDNYVEFILTDSQDSVPHSTDTLKEKLNLENTDIQTGGFSILIVEDNEELRSFLEKILSNNYTVITATNGKTGLQHAIEYIPDLIISDIMMPIMDGLDMVRQIKENSNICHIPIILLSAKASLDDRITGLEEGIDDYITKPFSATYLKARIISLIRQRKSLQEIYMNKITERNIVASDSLSSPSQPHITPYDKQFMKEIMSFMESQMDNPDLTVNELADHLKMSRTIFYRKLRGIVGLAPVDFIREVRIKRAMQLIDSDRYNISQVAYMTGFNDPKYFSKCFKKTVGLAPTEYKEQKK